MSDDKENIEQEKVNKNNFLKKLCSFVFIFLFISIFCCGCNNIKPHTENISTIGEWSVVDGEMDKARFHTSAELLPNGNVLILGGHSDINSAQIYNPSTGKITNINPPVYNRSTFFATTKLQDGRIYISGGDVLIGEPKGNEYPSNTTEIYDPATQTFTEAAKMKYYKVLHKAILLKNGHVLILHHLISSNPKKHDTTLEEKEKIKQEVYNPFTNKYYETKNVGPTSFNDTIVTLENGDLLILGNFKNYIYKVDENRFVEAFNDFHININHIVVALDNNTLLSVGGCGEDKENYIYKLKEKKKIPVNNYTSKTYCAGTRPQATVLDNKDVLITGMGITKTKLATEKPKKFKYTSYLYDYSRNEFIEIPSPEYEVKDAAIVKLNNGDVAYIGGQYRYYLLIISNKIQIFKQGNKE